MVQRPLQLNNCSGIFLKTFNVPGYPLYLLLAWSLNVTKIGADIAFATMNTVFNFIVIFVIAVTFQQK